VSRIGLNPIIIPDKVDVKIEDKLVTAKGPLGVLQYTFPDMIEVKIEDNVINVSRANNQPKIRSLHGLTRALISNMVEGVSKGFEKKLLIEGVGYKVELKGDRLFLSLGYSHPILFIPPEGISFEVESATIFKVKGYDKQLVGQIAAKIRKMRPPEPYKGKGIRYDGEYIRRKAGKTAA
jgi:large subunit ribosomal protein L6